MTAILDTVVATTFVFLLFSLVVTALNELVASLFDQRASFLKQALEELINTKPCGEPYDPKTDQSPVTVTKLLQHGLITSLSKGPYEEKNKGGDGVPSYIPAELFSSALISLLGDGSKEALQENIRKIAQGSRLRSSLQAIFDDTEGNLTPFRKRVEVWFEESMTRTSGWYKRSAQRTMFFLAFCLAVFCNVDTLRIVKELSVDDTLRHTLVREAATPLVPVSGSDGETLDKKRAAVDEALKQLTASGIPVGWKGTGLKEVFWEFLKSFPTSLVGWFITACAASLGAPFWFDTLGRFINIRSAGKPPEKAG